MANIFHITLDQLVNIEQPDISADLTNINLTNITLDELTEKNEQKEACSTTLQTFI